MKPRKVHYAFLRKIKNVVFFEGESIVSEFHNDLFQFNFNHQKWYTVALRPPKTQKTEPLAGVLSTDAASLLAEEEEHFKKHKAATKIQSRSTKPSLSLHELCIQLSRVHCTKSL